MCDDNFGMNLAHAICKSMGYPGAIAWKSVHRHGIQMWSIQEKYNIQLKLEHVVCPDNGTWSQCRVYNLDEFYCYHVEDVFLSCAGNI